MEDKKTITIENTRFVYETNFAGDPKKDNFGDSRRKANIAIPDKRMADELANEGFRVRQTKPGPKDDPNDYVPTYFVTAILKYRDIRGNEMRYLPKVYLVNDDNNPIPLHEDTVKEIDDMRVKNVNVILNAWDNGEGKSLYIRTMYVEQDVESDPFAARYANRRREE